MTDETTKQTKPTAENALNTASRILKSTENPSDEHLLACLAILSKIEPHKLTKKKALFNFLETENDGILLKFIQRLIITYNNKCESAGGNNAAKEYEAYATLAVNILLASEEFSSKTSFLLPGIVQAAYHGIIVSSKKKNEKHMKGNHKKSYIRYIYFMLNFITEGGRASTMTILDQN